MKKLTFGKQMTIGVVLMFGGFILADITNTPWIANLCQCLYGLMFIINPVWPQSADRYNHKKMKWGIRIAGVIFIVLSLITRYGYL